MRVKWLPLVVQLFFLSADMFSSVITLCYFICELMQSQLDHAQWIKRKADTSLPSEGCVLCCLVLPGRSTTENPDSDSAHNKHSSYCETKTLLGVCLLFLRL